MTQVHKNYDNLRDENLHPNTFALAATICPKQLLTVGSHQTNLGASVEVSGHFGHAEVS